MNVNTTFPTLYKKSSKGALQQWRVWVTAEEGFGVIYTEHGQVGGKLQVGRDVVREGKNPGKKNATTPFTQAESEAESEWRKKQERKGYVVEIERAKAGETNAEGGIAPMLAQTLEDLTKPPALPAHLQRKYNGLRCIVDVQDGVVSLWSRGRKKILGVPHIQAAYEKAFAGVEGFFRFDGELYRHGWPLQKISGFVRKEKTKPGFDQLCHNVYDMPSCEEPWETRCEVLGRTLSKYVPVSLMTVIRLVPTVTVSSMQEADQYHDEWVRDGYEGAILRSLSGRYKAGSRSIDLVKIKKWQDLEFPIVAVGEGRGKFEGKAVFTCHTVVPRDGEEVKEFECCAPGNMEDRAEFLRRKDELPGKLLTVKFFEWTEDRKPSHGVGMAVRDYE